MDSSSDSDDRRRKAKSSRKAKDQWGEEDILAKEVLRVISQNSQNHENMIQARQTKVLRLKLVEKKPYYLSDSTHCMQVIYKPPANQQKLNPLNKIDSQYYHIHQRPHIVFNCHDEILEQERPMYPSAYHPAYHYKNYEQFQERRKNTKILVSCEKVQVLSWSVIIRNVSRSGYYGPVLVIYQSRKGKGDNFVLENRVQNILFNKDIAVHLENFRVKDLRKFDFPKQKSQYSLMYYIRDRKTEKKPQSMSNFINVDTKFNILQTNQNSEINFICLGEMSAYEIFKRPIHQKYLCKKKQIINLNKFIDEEQRPGRLERQNGENSEENESNQSSFIENEQDQRDRQVFRQRDGEYEEGELYAMEDEGEKENRRNQYNRMLSESEDQDQDAQNEDQDYLKKVYLKVMRNQSFL